jgi:hypothetical protein
MKAIPVNAILRDGALALALLGAAALTSAPAAANSVDNATGPNLTYVGPGAVLSIGVD